MPLECGSILVCCQRGRYITIVIHINKDDIVLLGAALKEDARILEDRPHIDWVAIIKILAGNRQEPRIDLYHINLALRIALSKEARHREGPTAQHQNALALRGLLHRLHHLTRVPKWQLLRLPDHHTRLHTSRATGNPADNRAILPTPLLECVVRRGGVDRLRSLGSHHWRHAIAQCQTHTQHTHHHAPLPALAWHHQPAGQHKQANKHHQHVVNPQPAKQEKPRRKGADDPTNRIHRTE